jgi:hypothetical protein
MPDRPTIQITRREIQFRPKPGGTNRGWLYDVIRPDGTVVVYGTSRLSNARDMAKRAGFTPVNGW